MKKYNVVRMIVMGIFGQLGKISGIAKVPVQNLIDFNLKGRNVTGL